MAMVEVFDRLLETDRNEDAKDDNKEMNEEVAACERTVVRRVDVDHACPCERIFWSCGTADQDTRSLGESQPLCMPTKVSVDAYEWIAPASQGSLLNCRSTAQNDLERIGSPSGHQRHRMPSGSGEYWSQH